MSPSSGPRGPVAGGRRHRIRARLLLALGLAAVAAMPVVAFGGEGSIKDVADLPVFSTRTPATDADADGDATTGDDVTSDVPVGATPVFARRDGLFLHLPTTDARVIGFHEASTGVALPMIPRGRLTVNHNATRAIEVEEVAGGPSLLVMSSRGRGFASTSAVDIVLADDDPVLAPVSGVVADVRPTWLYGRYEDRRVEIHPDAAPHLRVVVVHVDTVTVVAGDRVEAGVTVIAERVNRFPFSSQIDRETEPERFGHVHLEVQPRDGARRGDPPSDDGGA